jgi:hypothetical protein
MLTDASHPSTLPLSMPSAKYEDGNLGISVRSSKKVTVDLLFEKTGICHPDRKSWPHDGEIIAQSNVPHFSLVAEVANTA